MTTALVMAALASGSVPSFLARTALCRTPSRASSSA
jgi:hypothetical protein